METDGGRTSTPSGTVQGEAYGPCGAQGQGLTAQFGSPEHQHSRGAESAMALPPS
jgi:hypothetical protein